MQIQAEQSSVGGTISEQCLITKALDEATVKTRFRLRQHRLRVWNPAEFHFNKSSE